MQGSAAKLAADKAPAAERDERRPESRAEGGLAPGFDLAAQIRRLQRSIGNQATARLLAQLTTRPRPDRRPMEPVTERLGLSPDAQMSAQHLALQETSAFGTEPGSGARFGLRDFSSRGEGAGEHPVQHLREADDATEADAERLADRVSMSGSTAAAGPADAEPKGGKTDAPLSSLTRATRSAALPPDMAAAIAGPGQELDAGLRSFFEPRFGISLATVRVHTDAMAWHSAAARNARAYAFGPHLVFGRNQYAPDTNAGRALVSHELAHVAQQSALGQPFLGRRESGQPDEIVTELRPGLKQHSGRGYTELEIGGRGWVRLEWNPAHRDTPKIEIVVNESADTEAVGLRITADFDVNAKLDRSVEDAGDEIFKAHFYRLFSYDFRFPGTLQVNTAASDPGSLAPNKKDFQRTKLPYRAREFYKPEINPEFPQDRPLIPPTPDLLDPLKDSPNPNKAPDERQSEIKEQEQQEVIRGQPAFATRAEMEAYIKQHPNESFIGIETTYGRFVARQIDEDELQRLATVVRSDAEDLPEVAWDAERRRSGWRITGIYQNGRLVDLHQFAESYYSDQFLASSGAPGDFEEAEVYRIGEHSFGRKSLTHDAALARWAQLDTMTSSQVFLLDTEPKHRFVLLRVSGVGHTHDIDQRYFHGRDEFFQSVVRFADTGANEVELYNRFASTDDIRYYLYANSDRERNNPAFVEALRKHGALAQAVSRAIYNEVQVRAQNLALQRIVAGAEQLRPFAEDAERMRVFVLGFPQLDEQKRKDAVAFIGVPEGLRSHVIEILSDRGNATRVALGLEGSVTVEELEIRGSGRFTHLEKVPHTYRVSLDLLMGWAQDTVTGLEQAAEQLRNGEVWALWLEGELGDTIRAQVYREFGFHLLDPKRFPHRDETSGWFPDPLDPGPLAFSSLAEQMYANRVHHIANDERVIRVLKVTALVVVTIVLILVAEEIGAVVAGYLFAEGSAAFVATELVVSGTVFTALEEVRTRALEGHWDSVGEVVGHAAINIATFGAFRFLNTLLAAGARSFVAGLIGEEAFTASRGAQRAAGALRITGIGAASLGIGIVQRLASGQGFSSTGDFALFAYENLLSVALLEGASVLSRPLMASGRMWARSQRLGAYEIEITNLQGDVARLQRNLVSTLLRPQASARDAPGLTEETTKLLQTQRDLCTKLRENFRNRGDAKALEAEAGQELADIEGALTGIEQAKFLTEQRIVPVEGSESVFTYEGGAAGVERFRQYYGADRVHVAEDGSIRVEVPGLETRELVFVPAENVKAPAGTGGAPKVPTLVEQQLALQTRQQALLSRASRLGVRHASLDAVRRLRPTQTTRPETLRSTEEAIIRAEREAGAAMDKLAKNILKNVGDRLGPGAIDQIRAGELSGISDTELADILWQARNLRRMGVAQYRALVFAARAGEPAIDFPKLLRTMRRGRFRVADRNFALETFAQLMELKVPGTRQMLADMSASTGKFRGGLFQMEVIRYIGGAERVASIEAPVEIGARIREYDITLRDGTRIECKDWESWEHADGLADQFERDVISLTGEKFTNPKGLRQVRYLFRLVDGKPVRPVTEIRSFLRARLERALTQRNADHDTRNAMLHEFDDFTDLVQAPNLQRTGGVPLPPIPIAPPSPALRKDEDEDENEDEGTE
jgi:hypothetical protein